MSRVGASTSFSDENHTIRAAIIVAVYADGTLLVAPSSSEPAHQSGTRARRRNVYVKDSQFLRYEES